VLTDGRTTERRPVVVPTRTDAVTIAFRLPPIAPGERQTREVSATHIDASLEVPSSEALPERDAIVKPPPAMDMLVEPDEGTLTTRVTLTDRRATENICDKLATWRETLSTALLVAGAMRVASA